MSLTDATRIVTRLGPCTVALDRARSPDLARHLARLGCVVREAGEAAPVRVVLAGDAPDAGAETLVVIAEGDRGAIETPLFARGWHRHPADLTVASSGEWTTTRLPRLTFYRRGGPDLLAAGIDADAAITRFALAADLVRSGDRVLVRGGDAVAGAAIMNALSRAGAVATDAGDVPVRAFDAIVLMLDPATATVAMLDKAAAALKRDGRLVVGWIGESAALDAAIADRFIVDRRWRQRDGGTLLVAAADPFGAPVAPYHHPAFHRHEGALSVLVDFAAAYENPDLYRTMVQLGERIGDALVLARLAECVLEEAGPASADRGAAVAVLGYRVLDLGLAGSIAAVVALIDDYLAATEGSNAPHVIRWRLSLLFLAGRLAELAGDPARAIERFNAASLADWAGFSPILATKSIAAAFHEARLHLAMGARGAAMACFRRGLDTALAAAAMPHDRLIGDRAAPVPFYLQEMAEIMDMGGQCAVAIHQAALLDRDPGLFWRQVDTKRFGLFAWADQLQREQSRLRG